MGGSSACRRSVVAFDRLFRGLRSRSRGVHSPARLDAEARDRYAGPSGVRFAARRFQLQPRLQRPGPERGARGGLSASSCTRAGCSCEGARADRVQRRPSLTVKPTSLFSEAKEILRYARVPCAALRMTRPDWVKKAVSSRCPVLGVML